MGRMRRDFVAGGIYHVYSRGSNRQAIFRYDSDRIDFLDCFERVVARYELGCLAYCLMPNHYHLVVESRDGRLSDAMKALNGRYALRFNRRYNRDAHLFRNRFGAVAQRSEGQLLWTVRYTVTNPVTVGLCGDPAGWPWSSYAASVGEANWPRFLDVRRLLSFFGGTSDSARSKFREFVAADFGV